MGEREQYDEGTFSWVDLGTSDLEAAKGFYTGLFGWDTEELPAGPGNVYTMASLGGRQVAGLMAAQQGQPPSWTSYVTVDDADAAAGRAGDLGGSVLAPAFDVMEAGRIAVLADPAGAVFALWQPNQTRGAGLVNAPGALALNQLTTPDLEGAKAFYSELFGWRFEEEQEDGSSYWGIYQDDRLNAGMMLLTPEMEMPPHWLVYFGHDDLDGASARIGDSGGTIMLPKMAVPGGEIVVAHDGQGAVFGLFAGRFDD